MFCETCRRMVARRNWPLTDAVLGTIWESATIVRCASGINAREETPPPQFRYPVPHRMRDETNKVNVVSGACNTVRIDDYKAAKAVNFDGLIHQLVECIEKSSPGLWRFFKS